MTKERMMLKDVHPSTHIRPLESDSYVWHFTFYISDTNGKEGKEQGIVHGGLKFEKSFPLTKPELKFIKLYSMEDERAEEVEESIRKILKQWETKTNIKTIIEKCFEAVKALNLKFVVKKEEETKAPVEEDKENIDTKDDKKKEEPTVSCRFCGDLQALHQVDSNKPVS